MSRLRRIPEDETKLDLTPMIDVTFLLLLFFLCTIRFKTLEGKLSAYLPKEVGVNPTLFVPIEKIDFEVRVLAAGEKRRADDLAEAWTGKGRFEYVGRRIEYRVGPRRYTGLDAVERRLRKLHVADPERTVVLRPQSGTTYGDVVPALDVLNGVGFREVTFQGAPSGF